MANQNMNEDLVSELRECASLLTKMAEDESYAVEKTASIGAAASSGRMEYMTGLMHGLGLEE